MFTGIIETTGKIQKLKDSQLTVECPDVVGELKTGSSIAVDGACLTVVGLSDESFTADFMPETAQKTIVGIYNIGTEVNLELPLASDGRFEGHIVTGHVEGMGEITEIKQDGNSYILTVKLPTELDKYVVQKGSITINGISLTVIGVHSGQFTVSIIPHTWELTNLHDLEVGGKVNLETDILAKHVERLMEIWKL